MSFHVVHRFTKGKKSFINFSILLFDTRMKEVFENGYNFFDHDLFPLVGEFDNKRKEIVDYVTRIREQYFHLLINRIKKLFCIIQVENCLLNLKGFFEASIYRCGLFKILI